MKSIFTLFLLVVSFASHAQENLNDKYLCKGFVDCKAKLGNDAIKIVQRGNIQYTWTLEAETNENHKVWMSPGEIIVSNMLPDRLDHYQATNSCSSSDDYQDEKGYLKKYRLPRTKDFDQMEAQGLREVIDTVDRKFWTNDTYPRAQFLVSLYNGNTGDTSEKSYSWLYSRFRSYRFYSLCIILPENN